MTEFAKEVEERLKRADRNMALHDAAAKFMLHSVEAKYSYNFSWLGRPIIQYPQDVVAVQELIWKVRPDLIVEAGIAHGGSLILSASLLAMLDVADAAAAGNAVNPRNSKRRVMGIDVDIRQHNRTAIEAHPLAPYIEMIQASSTGQETIDRVRERAFQAETVMVFLDSNHSHTHVLAELEAYAPLVSCGSYCVVFDTIVERLPKSSFLDRPWGPGDNPMTAVDAYLRDHPEFVIDDSLDNKLQISVAPRGYLKRM
jgi:cephalosporin hydroxylase